MCRPFRGCSSAAVRRTRSLGLALNVFVRISVLSFSPNDSIWDFHQVISMPLWMTLIFFFESGKSLEMVFLLSFEIAMILVV